MLTLVLVASIFVLRLIRSNPNFDLSRAIILGDPDKIIVINADDSQDVIIVGDPDKINVKPKKSNR